MIKRALAGQLAELMFTKNYREFLRGDLVPGRKVRINFDAERLPQVFDVPGASLEAHVRFQEQALPVVIPLESHTGILTRKSGVEPGAGSMVCALVQVPANAERFELWFSASFGGKVLGWDSDNGKNFSFPFVSRDVRISEATVEPLAGTDRDRFSVVVESASGVSGLALDYRVTNRVPVAPSTTRVALLQAGTAPDGWQRWSAPLIEVPHGAIVAFSVSYTRDGTSYFDDNHHRGYLAPVPELMQAEA
ncbi:MAG: DUF6209 family protein [Polyangiaceae bacterium]